MVVRQRTPQNREGLAVRFVGAIVILHPVQRDAKLKKVQSKVLMIRSEQDSVELDDLMIESGRLLVLALLTDHHRQLEHGRHRQRMLVSENPSPRGKGLLQERLGGIEVPLLPQQRPRIEHGLRQRRMPFAQKLSMQREGFPVIGLRTGQIRPIMVDGAEPHHRRRHLEMLVAESRPLNGQRFLQQPFRFVEPPYVSEQQGKIPQQEGRGDVVFSFGGT